MRAAATAVLAIAAAFGGMTLSGCATGASLTPTAVDTRSPVAARIAREAGTEARRPTFADIPATPRDVPTVAQYDQLVLQQRGQGAALNQWPVQNPPMNTDMAGFVAEARAALAPAGPPPTTEEAAASARFVAEQRARATAPPPPR